VEPGHPPIERRDHLGPEVCTRTVVEFILRVGPCILDGHLDVRRDTRLGDGAEIGPDERRLESVEEALCRFELLSLGPWSR